MSLCKGSEDDTTTLHSTQSIMAYEYGLRVVKMVQVA